MGGVPTLDQILNNLGLAASLPIETAAAVLVRCAAVQSAIAARLAGAPAEKPPAENEPLLTAGELASQLNVPETWVREQQRSGALPHERLGRYVRFRLSDVKRALAERQNN